MNKRLLYSILITLIVVTVVVGISTGSYLMIEELENYKCDHVNIGIIVFFSSLLIFLISLLFKHKLFVCCFDTIYIGFIALVASLITNGYIMFMIGYNNGRCLDYYTNNKEGDYYIIIVVSNTILVILLSICLLCC